MVGRWHIEVVLTICLSAGALGAEPTRGTQTGTDRGLPASKLQDSDLAEIKALVSKAPGKRSGPWSRDRLILAFRFFKPELHAEGWVECPDGMMERDEKRVELFSRRADRPRPRKITDKVTALPGKTGRGISRGPRILVNGAEWKQRNLKVPEILGLRSGNLAAEILACGLFRLVGLMTPEVEPVYLPDGRGGWNLTSITQLLTDTLVGERFWQARELLKSHKERLGTLIPEQYVTLRVMDVLMGNPDRHVGNWMMTASGRVIALDHDLAMVTPDLLSDPRNDWYMNFTRDISLERDTSPVDYVDASKLAGVPKVNGGIDRILRRGEDCPVLSGFVARDPTLPTRVARRIVGVLGNETVRKLVDDLPLATCDPDRRLELVTTLISRRNQLVTVVSRYFDRR